MCATWEATGDLPLAQGERSAGNQLGHRCVVGASDRAEVLGRPRNGRRVGRSERLGAGDDGQLVCQPPNRENVALVSGRVREDDRVEPLLGEPPATDQFPQ